MQDDPVIRVVAKVLIPAIMLFALMCNFTAITDLAAAFRLASFSLLRWC